MVAVLNVICVKVLFGAPKYSIVSIYSAQAVIPKMLVAVYVPATSAKLSKKVLFPKNLPSRNLEEKSNGHPLIGRLGIRRKGKSITSPIQIRPIFMITIDQLQRCTVKSMTNH